MSSAAMTPAHKQVAAPLWTTPEILRTGLVSIWIAGALLMAAAIAGARSHRQAIQVVGKDPAPNIRTMLADMDAHAMTDEKTFDNRRAEAAAALVTAAKHITSGDEEGLIGQLTLGLSTYTAMVQAARDRRDMAAWREAWKYLDATLLPAAARLDDANLKALNETSAAETKASTFAMTMLVLASILAGTALIVMQIFLGGRMRRTINPLLFLATLAALVWVIYAGQRFRAADRDLEVAQKEAIDTFHFRQARALAYSAEADLSRASFDTAKRADDVADFGQKADAIQELLAGEDEGARTAAGNFGAYRTAKTAVSFQYFDSELGKTLSADNRVFRSAVDRGLADVAWFEVTAPVWALAISVLAWLGLRPRIREYSA